jgi:YHS domain-containing protein
MQPMTSIRPLGWTAFALIALVGCEPAPTTTTPSSTPLPNPGPPPADAPKAPTEIKALPVEPSAKPGEPKKEADAAPAKLSDEEIAEVKKLPADEQALALAQVTCPVSGDHLGAMEKPIKQVVNGKTFYLCCAGCEKEVKAHPDDVLAKLKK